MPSALERSPKLESTLREMVEHHLALTHEPLHLALALNLSRDAGDAFLFELLGHFGLDEVSADREFFEATYKSSSDLDLDGRRKLHLILTHPEEFRVALEDGWPSAEEVRDAVRRGDSEVLFADEVGQKALEGLR